MDTYDTSGSTNTPRQQSFARDPLLWRYIQTRNASNLSITILPRNKTCSYDTSCIYPIATIILRDELNKLTESSKNQDYSSPPCAIPLGRLQLTLKIQHNGSRHLAAWLPDSPKQSYGEHIKEKPKEFHNRILQPLLIHTSQTCQFISWQKLSPGPWPQDKNHLIIRNDVTATIH